MISCRSRWAAKSILSFFFSETKLTCFFVKKTENEVQIVTTVRPASCALESVVDERKTYRIRLHLMVSERGGALVASIRHVCRPLSAGLRRLPPG